MPRQKQDVELTKDKPMILSIPSDEGVRYLFQMIRPKWLSEVSGMNKSMLSGGMNHTRFGRGLPYYFKVDEVCRINAACMKMGQMLISVKITDGVMTPEGSPLSHGTDTAEQLKCLSNYIQLAYVFETRMNKPSDWRMNRMHSGKMYNRFPSESINEMNSVIKDIALRLMGIELICQSRDNN